MGQTPAKGVRPLWISRRLRNIQPGLIRLIHRGLTPYFGTFHTSGCAAPCSARYTRSGVNGSEVMRTPVAL